MVLLLLSLESSSNILVTSWLEDVQPPVCSVLAALVTSDRTALKCRQLLAVALGLQLWDHFTLSCAAHSQASPGSF